MKRRKAVDAKLFTQGVLAAAELVRQGHILQLQCLAGTLSDDVYSHSKDAIRKELEASRAEKVREKREKREKRERELQQSELEKNISRVLQPDSLPLFSQLSVSHSQCILFPDESEQLGVEPKADDFSVRSTPPKPKTPSTAKITTTTTTITSNSALSIKNETNPSTTAKATTTANPPKLEILNSFELQQEDEDELDANAEPLAYPPSSQLQQLSLLSSSQLQYPSTDSTATTITTTTITKTDSVHLRNSVSTQDGDEDTIDEDADVNQPFLATHSQSQQHQTITTLATSQTNSNNNARSPSPLASQRKTRGSERGESKRDEFERGEDEILLQNSQQESPKRRLSPRKRGKAVEENERIEQQSAQKSTSQHDRFGASSSQRQIKTEIDVTEDDDELLQNSQRESPQRRLSPRKQEITFEEDRFIVSSSLPKSTAEMDITDDDELLQNSRQESPKRRLSPRKRANTVEEDKGVVVVQPAVQKSVSQHVRFAVSSSQPQSSTEMEVAEDDDEQFQDSQRESPKRRLTPRKRGTTFEEDRFAASSSQPKVTAEMDVTEDDDELLQKSQRESPKRRLSPRKSGTTFEEDRFAASSSQPKVTVEMDVTEGDEELLQNSQQESPKRRSSPRKRGTTGEEDERIVAFSATQNSTSQRDRFVASSSRLQNSAETEVIEEEDELLLQNSQQESPKRRLSPRKRGTAVIINAETTVADYQIQAQTKAETATVSDKGVMKDDHALQNSQQESPNRRLSPRKLGKQVQDSSRDEISGSLLQQQRSGSFNDSIPSEREHSASQKKHRGRSSSSVNNTPPVPLLPASSSTVQGKGVSTPTPAPESQPPRTFHDKISPSLSTSTDSSPASPPDTFEKLGRLRIKKQQQKNTRRKSSAATSSTVRGETTSPAPSATDRSERLGETDEDRAASTLIRKASTDVLGGKNSPEKVKRNGIRGQSLQSAKIAGKRKSFAQLYDSVAIDGFDHDEKDDNDDSGSENGMKGTEQRRADQGMNVNMVQEDSRMSEVVERTKEMHKANNHSPPKPKSSVSTRSNSPILTGGVSQLTQPMDVDPENLDQSLPVGRALSDFSSDSGEDESAIGDSEDDIRAIAEFVEGDVDLFQGVDI